MVRGVDDFVTGLAIMAAIWIWGFVMLLIGYGFELLLQRGGSRRSAPRRDAG